MSSLQIAFTNYVLENDLGTYFASARFVAKKCLRTYVVADLVLHALVCWGLRLSFGRAQVEIGF